MRIFDRYRSLVGAVVLAILCIALGTTTLSGCGVDSDRDVAGDAPAVADDPGAPLIGDIDADPNQDWDATGAYDETLNLQPGFNLYQADPRFRDLFNSAGRSPLCFPTTVAHRVLYQKHYRRARADRLRSVGDLDRDGQTTRYDFVRYFARECGTQPFAGTSLTRGVKCIRDYYRASGYGAAIRVIGRNGEPGSSRIDVPRLHEYLRDDAGVMGHLGWYKLNARKNAWIRTGGHYFNIYGFKHQARWGTKRTLLFVANPIVDYADRDPSRMYDEIRLRPLNKPAGIRYPSEVSFALEGLAFGDERKRAFLEDVVVFSPTD